MTVSNQDSRTGPYSGDGSTVVFAYDFLLLDEDHIVVTITDADGNNTVQPSSAYSVSGVGSDTGGNVTMNTAPTSTEELTITREVTLEQLVDLQNRGTFFPSTIERSLDLLVQMVQDQQEQIDRSIKQNVTETDELEFPAGSADKVLGWNSAGDTLVNLTPTDVLDIPGATTDNGIVRWDGADGLGLQDSSVLIDDSDQMSGVARLDVDNIRVDGNTISSTDTNGNLNLTPDGSGALVLDGSSFTAAQLAELNEILGTGAIRLPVGTTAQRPTPVEGDVRRNTTTGRFEGYDGSAWGALGGGAAGGGSDAVFFENDQNVTSDYTITSSKNAMSAGTVTIDNGVTVTVPSGSRWVVI